MLLKPVSFLKKAAGAAAFTVDFSTYSDGELGSVSGGAFVKRRTTDTSQTQVIASGELEKGNGFAASVYAYDDTFAADHYSNLTISTLTNSASAGPAIAVQSDGDCIYAAVRADRIQLRRIDAGSDTYINQSAVLGTPPAVGHIVRIEKDETNDEIRVYIDQGGGFGSAIITQDVSAQGWWTGGGFTGGQAGTCVTNDDVQFSDWAGGDL